MAANKYARRDNFGHQIRTPLLREHFVYRAFDSAGRLLYVGCSARIQERMKDHRSNSDWWHLMTRVTLAGPYNYETARDLEYQAIESERALFNFSSERRSIARLHDSIIKRYLQVVFGGDFDEGGIHAAVSFADRHVRYEGRGPLEITDASLMAAHRARHRAFQVIDEKAHAA